MSQSPKSSTNASEPRTNQLILKERKDADQTSLDTRLEADKNRVEERLASGPDTTGDWKRSDARLNVEREDSDRAMGLERARADSAETRASQRLSDEIAEHSKTKISVTTRDEFLAIVSHDLRNPIGTVSSCAGMLLDDPSFQNMTADIRTYIQMMKRNADASLRLINDLLDMERVAEDKFQLHLKLHSINEIIQECIENFSHLAAAKSLQISAVLVEGAGMVLCDRDRVTQIITNLMGNAVKFTHVGGSIVVRAIFSETQLEVSVADKGPGIAEEMQDKIFSRFAQLASKDRTGLGLGLYISKILVEAHQGLLWVKSRVGDGSTFYFTIPRKADIPLANV